MWTGYSRRCPESSERPLSGRLKLLDPGSVGLCITPPGSDMIFKACSVAVVAALFTSEAAAQSLSGYQYVLRMESGSSEEFFAEASDAGDRARLELHNNDHSYLLIL